MELGRVGAAATRDEDLAGERSVAVRLWRARPMGAAKEKALASESYNSTELSVLRRLLPPVTSALPEDSAVSVCR